MPYHLLCPSKPIVYLPPQNTVKYFQSSTPFGEVQSKGKPGEKLTREQEGGHKPRERTAAADARERRGEPRGGWGWGGERLGADTEKDTLNEGKTPRPAGQFR